MTINIGGLLSWLVSFSSSVPELTRHGVGRGLHVNSSGWRVLQKRGTCPLVLLWESEFTRHVSALSLSCKIRFMFEAHWPMKAVPLKHVLGWGVGSGESFGLYNMFYFVFLQMVSPESTIEGNIF